MQRGEPFRWIRRTSVRTKVIGLVLPPPRDGEPPWAAVLAWREEGWIDLERPLPADHDLLQLAQAAARGDAPGTGVTVHGWATPPRLDPLARTLRWGTRVRFAGGGAIVVR